MNQNEQLVKLHYPVIAPLIMCNGVGDGKTMACVMAQAATIYALSQGKTLEEPTDELHCACPLLRHMAIRANDTEWWRDNLERTEHLRPLIPLLLNSRQDGAVTWKRIFHVVDNIVRILTPQRLEFLARKTTDKKLKQANLDWAKKLRRLPKIMGKESCKAAREVCLKLHQDASVSAYASASASVYASVSASASASASVSASVYASVSAYVSAYADADEKIRLRTQYLALFREVAAIV